MTNNHRKKQKSKILSTAAAAALVVALTLTVGPIPAAEARSAGTVLPLVPTINAKNIDRSLFSPEEQVFGRYLLVLPEIANSIVDDREADYGWMEDGWWRDVNDPGNKRIMEQVYTLSWFYSNERAWNPYSGNEALLGRLDAALGYYLKGQLSNGAITHNGKAHLASTGFGILSLAKTLEELKRANVLPERQAEIEEAIREGSKWLTDKRLNHWKPQLKYFNQLVAGLVAVEVSSRILEDPSVAAPVDELIGYLIEEGVSPAGYFNEPLSLDAGYNWTVALPDIADLYGETGDERLLDLARKFVENYRYTTMLEPGNDYNFTHFTSASARTEGLVHSANVGDERDALAAQLLEAVPEAAPFFPSAETKATYRDAWSKSTTLLTPLRKGATSPRNLMHIPKAPLGAPEELRQAQLESLPYLAEDRFTEIRKGTVDQDLLLVKRPGYYMGSVVGEREKGTRTKTGTGFLWNPDYGIVLLGLNRYASEGTDIAWTTSKDGVLSSQYSTTYGYRFEEEIIAPEVLDDLAGDFTNWYNSVEGGFQSEVTYEDDRIVKLSKTSGVAEEILPLTLGADDQIIFDGDVSVPGDVANFSTEASGFTLVRNGKEIEFSWGEELPITMQLDRSSLFNGTAQKKLINPMRISFSDELELAIQFPDVISEEPPVTEPEPPVQNPDPVDPPVELPEPIDPEEETPEPVFPPIDSETPDEETPDEEPSISPEPYPTTEPIATVPKAPIENTLNESLERETLENDSLGESYEAEDRATAQDTLAETGSSLKNYPVVIGGAIALLILGGILTIKGRRKVNN